MKYEVKTRIGTIEASIETLQELAIIAEEAAQAAKNIGAGFASSFYHAVAVDLVKDIPVNTGEKIGFDEKQERG